MLNSQVGMHAQHHTNKIVKKEFKNTSSPAVKCACLLGVESLHQLLASFAFCKTVFFLYSSAALEVVWCVCGEDDDFCA